MDSCGLWIQRKLPVTSGVGHVDRKRGFCRLSEKHVSLSLLSLLPVHTTDLGQRGHFTATETKAQRVTEMCAQGPNQIVFLLELGPFLNSILHWLLARDAPRELLESATCDFEPELLSWRSRHPPSWGLGFFKNNRNTGKMEVIQGELRGLAYHPAPSLERNSATSGAPICFPSWGGLPREYLLPFLHQKNPALLAHFLSSG